MAAREKVGVWLIGARGSVATTAMTGAAALAAGLSSPVGLVTSLPPFQDAGLPEVSDLVFGGHDIIEVPLTKRAELIAEAGVVPPGLVRAVVDGLEQCERSLRRGVESVEGHQREAVSALAEDLRRFRSEHGLARVVVINVSSTEPPAPFHPAHEDLPTLRRTLASNDDVLSVAATYAYAALDADCSFVDFTPSDAATLPALAALARERGVPLAGRDGKTGETLVKSALAPMFAARALKVRSWAGTNLLGGGDGETLSDPRSVRSKLDSKGRCLEEILGYEVEAPVRIQYVGDLGEWKTAWDHVSFEGFLGTRMRMQFLWEGCDSALAAPLILDLARLAARAHAAGCAGPLPELAFFFKDPIGAREHRLERQFTMLCEWVRGLSP